MVGWAGVLVVVFDVAPKSVWKCNLRRMWLKNKVKRNYIHLIFGDYWHVTTLLFRLFHKIFVPLQPEIVRRDYCAHIRI